MAINNRTLEETLEKFNKEFQSAANNNITNSVMGQISGAAQKLSMLKMLQQLAPLTSIMPANNPYFNPLMATAMASNAFKDSRAHLTTMDNFARLKAMQSLERKIQYDNALGDAGARAAMGFNNIGTTLGITGSVVKAAGMMGYMPNVLGNVNPLTLMGLMQGGKGLGTLSAGLMGGPDKLGALLGAGGTGMMGAINPMMAGVGLMMALNMGGGKLNQALLNGGSFAPKKFRADISLNLHNGMQLEMEHSSMVQISAQIKMMTNQNMLSPGEALHANILMLIESHTSVLGPILAELRNAEEIKNKSGGNAGQNDANDLFGEDGLMELRNQRGTRRTPNIFQRGLAKFARTTTNINSLVDIFGQIGNTLSGKSSTALFNEANRKPGEADANQMFSEKFGISVTFTQIIHTSASEVLNKSQSYEAKNLSILAGMYELNRFQAHELLSIRKDGLGVDRPGHTGELARLRLQEADSPEEEKLITLIDEMLGYIPLWHTISGTAKMVMAGYENVKEMIDKKTNPFREMIKAIGNGITSTWSMVDKDEGSLRATIGATKLSPSELMARYLSGDYVKQMTLLLQYNREQAYYLKYIANSEARKRGDRSAHVPGLDHGEETYMDEFSGRIITTSERRTRDREIGRKLGEHLNTTMPQGIWGMMLSPFFSRRKMGAMAEDDAIENLNHVKELYKQFGNNSGYRAGRVQGRRASGFAKGGYTGKPSIGDQHGISSGSNETIKGTVGANEGVMPEMSKKPSWFKDLFNGMLPNHSTKVPLTSSEQAEVQATKVMEEQQASDIHNQTETQTGMLGYLKKIFLELEKGNQEKEKRDIGNWELGDLIKALAGIAGLAALVSSIKDIKEYLDENKAMLAALAAGLGIPLVKKLFTSLAGKFPGAAGVFGAMSSKVGSMGGMLAGLFSKQHGPALPPGMEDPNDWKNRLKTTSTTLSKEALEVGKLGLNAGNSLVKSGLKYVGKTGGIGLALTGIAEYFLQDDNNADGTPKSFMEKLKTAGIKTLEQTGTLIGGTLGMGIGAMIPVPGGALIGGIAGGLLGDYLQGKISTWWTNYGKAKKEDKELNFKDKALKFLSENWGAGIGAGIGILAGTAGGPLGMAAGGILGGILGGRMQENIDTLIDGFKTDNWDMSKIVGSGFDMAVFTAGAAGGFTVGGPIGALIGGILALLLKDGVAGITNGIKEYIDKKDSSPQTVEQATEKAKVRLDNIVTHYNQAKERGDKILPDTEKQYQLALKDLERIEKGTYIPLMDNNNVGLGQGVDNRHWFDKQDTRYGSTIKNALDQLVKVESGGSYNAVNKTSGALGRYQFMATALKDAGLVKSDAPNTLALSDPKWWNNGLSKEKFLANHNLQDSVFKSFSAGNIQSLQKRGYAMTAFNIYGAHQQGVGGFNKIMSGTPLTSVEVKALNANLPDHVKKDPKYGADDRAKWINYWHEKISGEKINTVTKTPTPVESKTPSSTKAKNIELKQQAEIKSAKVDEALERKKEQERHEQTSALLAETNQKLQKANEINAYNAQVITKMSQEQEQAKTLWDYIEKVYNAPHYIDYQLSPIFAR